MPRRPREHGDDGTPRRVPPGPSATPPTIAAAHDSVDGAAQLGRQSGSVSTPPPSPITPPVARAFVDNITADPRSVAGRSARDIADRFTAAGYTATIEQSTKKGTSGNAVQVRIHGHPEITNIQVHPGGGRHTPPGSPYWKISTNTSGRTWVIPGDFRGADALGGNVVRYDE